MKNLWNHRFCPWCLWAGCRISLLLLGWLCLGYSLQAQIPIVDSLRMNILGAADIDKSYVPEDEKIVLGANRIAENSDEIAVQTYIITRKQILENGWSTLI